MTGKEERVPASFKEIIIEAWPKERTFEMGISVINACLHHQTEMGAPEENRFTQPYHLSVFPLMTFDQFEVILKVLGLVSESRSKTCQPSLGVKHANIIQDLTKHLKVTDCRSYPLTRHLP